MPTAGRDEFLDEGGVIDAEVELTVLRGGDEQQVTLELDGEVG